MALKESWARLNALRGSRMGNQIALVYSTQIAQAVVGFATSLVLIRGLSVADYGAFSIFLSSFMMLSGLAHWGWIDTYTRFGALHRRTDFYPSLEVFFRSRVLLLAAIAGVGLAIAAKPLAVGVYGRPEWVPLFLVASVAGWLTCWQSFEMNRVRVFQRFRLFFVLNVGASILRVGILAALLVAGSLVALNVSLAYTASTLCLLLAVWIFFPFARSGSQIPAKVRAETAHYNRWLLLSIVSTTLFTNLDVHFLTYFAGSEATAQLSAASRLTLPISFLVNALTTTLLPRLSESQHDPEFSSYYLRQLRHLLPLLVIGFGAGGAVLIPVLTWLAGSKYSGLGPLIGLQLVSILFVLVTNPFGILLSAQARTRALALMNLLQLGTGIALHFVLTARWGPVGAVMVGIVVNAMGMITVLLLTRRSKL